jgi:hypothetical protein
MYDHTSEREERAAKLEAQLVTQSGPPSPLQLVEQLGQALDQLETQLDRLRERLEPVLVEARPSPALASEPTPGRTLLAQRLMHLAGWAERLAEGANELHGRVEL